MTFNGERWLVISSSRYRAIQLQRVLYDKASFYCHVTKIRVCIEVEILTQECKNKFMSFNMEAKVPTS